MKTKLFLAFLALVFTSATGFAQTTYYDFYSPGGVGHAVQATANTGHVIGDVFVWDLDSYEDDGADIISIDGYEGAGISSLTITTGEFRVVLGADINLNDSFWDKGQTWDAIITGSSLPELNTGFVSAYTYDATDETYTLVNPPTNHGRSFMLTGDKDIGYSVVWAAVPEPSSALAGLLLALGLMRRRR